MFPLSPTMWIYAGVGVLVLALGAGVKIQSSRLETCKTSHEAFVATVKAQGELAAKEAQRVNLANQKALEAANHEYAKTKSDLASSYAAYRKLRNSGSGSRNLPEAPAVTSGANRTCFDSAKFAGAMGVIETGVPNIIEQGDVAKSRLIGAMKWAESLSKP